MTTVGYGDNTALDKDSYDDCLIMICLLIFGIFYFSFFSGEIGQFLSESNERKSSVHEILDDKEDMINCLSI